MGMRLALPVFSVAFMLSSAPPALAVSIIPHFTGIAVAYTLEVQHLNIEVYLLSFCLVVHLTIYVQVLTPNPK